MKTIKIKINSSYGVSSASLDILKIILIKEVRKNSNRKVQLSVSELAERCSLSVSTTKKSRLVLAREGVIKRSRKNPNLYIYKGNLGEFDTARHQLFHVAEPTKSSNSLYHRS